MFKIVFRSRLLLSLLFASTLLTFNVQAGMDIQHYMVTPIVGSHGSVSPNTAQTIDSGNNITFTATPNTNYMVNQWKVDGHVAQTGGVSFTLNNVTANHSVALTFVPKNLLYVGGANSYLYYSMDSGTSWHTTPMRPNVNNAIGGVFATNFAVYVVTTSKYVFYSSNNGVTWNSTTTTPDYGGVDSIFVTPANTIYIGTKKGHVYHSTNSGVTWTATAHPPSIGNVVHSIFVTTNGLYVGSSDGNVYYSPDDGVTWTAINGSPDGSGIHNVYVTGSTVYANTANEYVYTSTNLTGGGTWTGFAQGVYSLFVNADASIIDAATQDGHVFSLNTGNEIGFVSYTPINSVFLLG